MDPLTGPIHVEGAEPGDCLAVEILQIETGSWGWSAILPDLGLLQDRYPGPYLKLWDLSGGAVDIGRGLRFPLRPMIGVIGVAPAASGPHASTVPTAAGGNIDVKYTRAGSRIHLPVFVEGGLLSLGDAHALQGDGELNGTAIECEAEIRIRVELQRGRMLSAPTIDTPEVGPQTSERFRSFLGIGPDLWEAAREASQRGSNPRRPTSSSGPSPNCASTRSSTIRTGSWGAWSRCVSSGEHRYARRGVDRRPVRHPTGTDP
jgi:acetamidase/formamidase